MRSGFSPIFTCVSILTLLLAAGCGGDQGSSESATPASGSTNTAKPDATNDVLQTNLSPSIVEQPDFRSLHPLVLIETSLGNITIELDGEKAPLTVENFFAYVDGGHYNHAIIHQVFKDQGVVGGAFTPELIEKTTRAPIYNEAYNGLKNTAGTIAMARQPDVINSATCHFFLNVADNPELDYKGRTPGGYGYCVFGKVTEGLDVVSKIAAREVHDTEKFDRIPVETVLIKSIRRL